MSLARGTRLGPYEIFSPIGAGGMGEVYRAKDTRLDRMVAIKVLPRHIANVPEARQRLEREARVVSSLNHPNICTLHDIGHQDGIDFIVMEFLEGETLAERLKKGPLPLDQALRYGVQIAEALDRAHRQGVVHRDLKPANIMLTKDGAKVLDFGLAKLAARHPSPQDATQTIEVTSEGTIVGTLQYMAPEQLEGKEADARTDIFAFGAVVYEMATRRKAFEGKSQASLISAIMSSDPRPISTLQPMTSPALDHLVKQCLKKDADQRWQTAHDAVLELQWIAEGVEDAASPSARTSSLSWKWMAGGVFLVAVSVGIARLFPQTESTRPAMKLSILAPEKAPYESYEVISPDGRSLTFTAVGPSGQVMLWIRPLDSLTSVQVPGTEGARDPFWSPDSRLIGFFTLGKMKKVSTDLGSGPPLVQTLADTPDPRGGAWSSNGVIVFARNLEDGLYRVPASGGEVTPVTTLDRAKQENSHRWPHFFPDGRHLLYLARSSMLEHQGIYVGTPGSKDWKLLLRTPLNALVAGPLRRRLPTGLFSASRGYLLFMRERALLAQPINLNQLELTGDPSPLAEPVAAFNNRGVFSVSSDLTLTYRTSTNDEPQSRWFDRTGKPLGNSAMPGDGPRVSPDGKQVALHRLDRQSGAGDIWLEDVSRRVVTRLTSHPAYDWIPIWSPDMNSIVFASNRGRSMDLYQKGVSGSEPERQILKSDKRKTPTDWSRDGQFVIFQQEDPKTKWDLWALPMTGDRKPFPILQSEFNESQGALSPDGKWLAYTSDDTGSYQVYVQPFAGRPASGGTGQISRGKSRISTEGGMQPRWRSDGKELFYVSPDQKIVSVAVKARSAFEAGMPVPLFASTLELNGNIVNYDVMPDGKRFLISIPSKERGSTPVTIVLNWTAGLKK